MGLQRNVIDPPNPQAPGEKERPPQRAGKAKARPRRTPPSPQQSKAMDEGDRTTGSEKSPLTGPGQKEQTERQ